MADEFKEVAYGKTAKVTLADGKEYTMREPDMDTLERGDLDINDLVKKNTITKVAYLMLKEHHKDISENKVKKLITFRMLLDSHPFMRTYLDLLGISLDSKNE